jgi:signal transduction histidine kinase
MTWPDIQLPIYLVNITIGVILMLFVMRKINESWNRLLLVLAFVVIVGNILQALEKLNLLLSIRNDTLSRLPFYITFLAAILYCSISFAFTRTSFSKPIWLLVTLLWVCLVPGILELRGDIRVLRFLPLGNWAIFIGWGFFLTLSVIHILGEYRKTAFSLHRNRLQYWFLYLIILVLSSVLIFLEKTVPGYSLMTICVILISMLSLNHHLPDIRQIFKKTLAYVLIALVSVITYTSSFILFRFTSSAWTTPGTAAILSLILAAVLVFIANPLINIFSHWVTHQIIGNVVDTAQLITSYSNDISNIIDINQLAKEIIRKISQDFHLEYGVLFSVEKINNLYILLAVQPDPLAISMTQRYHHLSETSPIVQWLVDEERAITQYDLDFHPRLLQANPEEKEWISNYRMDIFVPILSKDEWIGLIALGPKQTGDRFFEEEIELLNSLAGQTAVGLRNARLYEDLKKQNAEIEKLNFSLSEANQELSRLDQAKTDFISIASHEIRTPLTQVIGYNDILNDMVKGGNVPRTAGLQMTDGVRKAARRLEDIVDTMFDVTKLDTRTLDMHFSDVQLQDIITQASEKWTIAFEDRKQTFIVKGLRDLPAIQADNRRLQQVFTNLIQNAIKYTPDGGQIQVTGKMAELNSSEDKTFIEVTVADTGIGVNGEDLEKIFEKFYRVGNVMLHSSGETKYKGAGPGLGLTIARGIVDAHGGKIWAESPGNDDVKCPGSVFHVLIPVSQTANRDTPK